MDSVSYYYVNKSDWPDGPWRTEPDRVEWRDPATGLQCRMSRGVHHGAYCGYVGVTAGHPYFEKNPLDAGSPDLHCHGGANFAQLMDGIWWIGFDCSHSWDYPPGQGASMARLGMPDIFSGMFCEGGPAAYRDHKYVMANVKLLAIQLHTLVQAGPKQEVECAS